MEAEHRFDQGLAFLDLDRAENLPYLINLLGYPSGDVDLDKIAGETLGIRTRDAVFAMLLVVQPRRKSPAHAGPFATKS